MDLHRPHPNHFAPLFRKTKCISFLKKCKHRKNAFFDFLKDSGLGTMSIQQNTKLLVQFASTRALYDQMRPHWWKNKILQEIRSENKVTTLTLGLRSVNNLRSQSFFVISIGSIWFLNDFEPGVPKFKQFTNSLFKYFLFFVGGCDFLFVQRKIF